MISIDWTFLASGLVFLFTLWALNRFLFKPLFVVMDERKRRTSDRKEKARETENYYRALFEEYSDKIKEEKRKGYRLAEESRNEALQERNAQASVAREQAEELISKARQEVEKEIGAGKDGMKREAEEIAGLIENRILQGVQGESSAPR